MKKADPAVPDESLPNPELKQAVARFLARRCYPQVLVARYGRFFGPGALIRARR